MILENKLFILSNGRVAAIDKKTGDIVWEVKLSEYVSAMSLAASIGQIFLQGDKLYIGISGILICISAKDGALVWKNELKGWGYYFVSIANANSAAAQEQADAATVAVMAATAATTGTNT